MLHGGLAQLKQNTAPDAFQPLVDGCRLNSFPSLAAFNAAGFVSARFFTDGASRLSKRQGQGQTSKKFGERHARNQSRPVNYRLPRAIDSMNRSDKDWLPLSESTVRPCTTAKPLLLVRADCRYRNPPRI